MNRPQPENRAKSSLELIEQAVHLLRQVPLSVVAGYYVGTLPFVLAALYFWGDMSHSPVADRHLGEAALGMAVLFLWMKLWQAIFASQLRETLGATGLAPISIQSIVRVLGRQSLLQATGLFFVPLALFLLAPFGWVFNFYQNLSVLGGGEEPRLKELLKRAMKCARLWPRQNHALLVALFAFAGLVFLNWGSICFVLPGLAKMLLGIESIFTRSGPGQLNSTFFAVAFGLTYLSVDPIVKAVYTVRCFYSESLKTGQDLSAELKAIRRRTAGAVVVALFLGTAMLVTAASAVGQDALGVQQRTPKGSDTVSTPELERAIDRIAHQPKYAWRAPQEKAVESDSAEGGFFRRWLARVGKFCRQTLKSIGEWLDNWLRKLFNPQRSNRPGGSGYGWILAEEILLYGLVLAAAIGLVLLILRTWRPRRNPASAVASIPIAPIPDLNDHNVGAEQLPEDGWTRLARELLARGELRLALRAFYFSNLVHLAERNLIQLAKFKSNREYEHELRRRAHAFPGLLPAFSENIGVFDRIWYGLHEVSSDLVERFRSNLERMRSIR